MSSPDLADLICIETPTFSQTASGSTSRTPGSWENRLPKLPSTVEWATIIAVASAASYFFGYVYYGAYFTRLSIDHRAVDLPTIAYIMQSISSIVPVLILTPFYWVYSRSRWGARRTTIVGSVITLAFSLAMLYAWMRDHLSASDAAILTFVVSYIVLFIPVVSYLRRQKESNGSLYGDPLSFVAVVLVSLLIIIMWTIHDAESDAVQDMEGRSPAVMRVTLKLKTPDPNLDGKPLILVVMRNGYYFLVEQQEPAPKNPRVYVISEDDVLYAEMQQAEPIDGTIPATPIPGTPNP